VRLWRLADQEHHQRGGHVAKQGTAMWPKQAPRDGRYCPEFRHCRKLSRTGLTVPAGAPDGRIIWVTGCPRPDILAGRGWAATSGIGGEITLKNGPGARRLGKVKLVISAQSEHLRQMRRVLIDAG